MSLPTMLPDFLSGRLRMVFHSRVISALLPVRVYCCCTQPINPVGCIYETGHVCLERMVPGTWRVVFSSTGDLAPARGAAVFPLSGRLWVEAVRCPLRSVLVSIAVVLLLCDGRVCGQPLVRLSRIPVCDDCLQSLSPADVNACCVCGEALGRSWVEEPVALCCTGRRAHPHFDLGICFGAYDGALRRVHHRNHAQRMCSRAAQSRRAKPVIVATVARVYRQVAEIAPGGVPNREKNAARFAEAVAG